MFGSIPRKPKYEAPPPQRPWQQNPEIRYQYAEADEGYKKADVYRAQQANMGSINWQRAPYAGSSSKGQRRDPNLFAMEQAIAQNTGVGSRNVSVHMRRSGLYANIKRQGSQGQNQETHGSFHTPGGQWSSMGGIHVKTDDYNPQTGQYDKPRYAATSYPVSSGTGFSHSTWVTPNQQRYSGYTPGHPVTQNIIPSIGRQFNRFSSSFQRQGGKRKATRRKARKSRKTRKH